MLNVPLMATDPKSYLTQRDENIAACEKGLARELTPKERLSVCLLVAQIRKAAREVKRQRGLNPYV